ncbi:MAG: XerD/XerC family integrase [Candidatus Methanohalarchaeum thermophilum]|uniref:XerD/XerC family integrase n=1 Tax=Methanohalarchaeum thermophilum TaxID=1903181 RepID=A0A1Q6DTZ4_METT1|nr:MAG: XerD/XerC family integrase [Candidatus Methanohalarchaeum thermophilum]
MKLTPSQIDFNNRAIYPKSNRHTTKGQWVTFYNKEAENLLKELEPRKDSGKEIFDFVPRTLTRDMRKTSKKEGIMKITPQVLRIWFCNEMNDLGVADRYIDAFCGRVPKSVLAKHYTDFTPNRLKEIYDKADIEVIV